MLHFEGEEILSNNISDIEANKKQEKGTEKQLHGKFSRNKDMIHSEGEGSKPSNNSSTEDVEKAELIHTRPRKLPKTTADEQLKTGNHSTPAVMISLTKTRPWVPARKSQHVPDSSPKEDKPHLEENKDGTKPFETEGKSTETDKQKNITHLTKISTAQNLRENVENLITKYSIYICLLVLVIITIPQIIEIIERRRRRTNRRDYELQQIVTQPYIQQQLQQKTVSINIHITKPPKEILVQSSKKDTTATLQVLSFHWETEPRSEEEFINIGHNIHNWQYHPRKTGPHETTIHKVDVDAFLEKRLAEHPTTSVKIISQNSRYAYAEKSCIYNNEINMVVKITKRDDETTTFKTFLQQPTKCIYFFQEPKFMDSEIKTEIHLIKTNEEMISTMTNIFFQKREMRVINSETTPSLTKSTNETCQEFARRLKQTLDLPTGELIAIFIKGLPFKTSAKFATLEQAAETAEQVIKGRQEIRNRIRQHQEESKRTETEAKYGQNWNQATIKPQDAPVQEEMQSSAQRQQRQNWQGFKAFPKDWFRKLEYESCTSFAGRIIEYRKFKIQNNPEVDVGDLDDEIKRRFLVGLPMRIRQEMGNQYFRTLDQARLKAQEVEERQQRQLELTTTQDRHTTQQRTEQSDSNEPSSSRQQGHQRSNRIPWKYNLLVITILITIFLPDLAQAYNGRQNISIFYPKMIYGNSRNMVSEQTSKGQEDSKAMIASISTIKTSNFLETILKNFANITSKKNINRQDKTSYNLFNQGALIDVNQTVMIVIVMILVTTIILACVCWRFWANRNDINTPEDLESIVRQGNPETEPCPELQKEAESLQEHPNLIPTVTQESNEGLNFQHLLPKFENSDNTNYLRFLTFMLEFQNGITKLKSKVDYFTPEQEYHLLLQCINEELQEEIKTKIVLNNLQPTVDNVVIIVQNFMKKEFQQFFKLQQYVQKKPDETLDNFARRVRTFVFQEYPYLNNYQCQQQKMIKIFIQGLPTQLQQKMPRKHFQNLIHVMACAKISQRYLNTPRQRTTTQSYKKEVKRRYSWQTIAESDIQSEPLPNQHTITQKQQQQQGQSLKSRRQQPFPNEN